MHIEFCGGPIWNPEPSISADGAILTASSYSLPRPSILEPLIVHQMPMRFLQRGKASLGHRLMSVSSRLYCYGLGLWCFPHCCCCLILGSTIIRVLNHDLWQYQWNNIDTRFIYVLKTAKQNILERSQNRPCFQKRKSQRAILSHKNPVSFLQFDQRSKWHCPTFVLLFDFQWRRQTEKSCTASDC